MKKTDKPVALAIEEFQTAKANLDTANAHLASLQAQMDAIQTDASTAERELEATQARHSQELINIQRRVDDRHQAVRDMGDQIAKAFAQQKVANEEAEISRAALKEAVDL